MTPPQTQNRALAGPRTLNAPVPVPTKVGLLQYSKFHLAPSSCAIGLRLVAKQVFALRLAPF
jgi:hypothetical protein